MRVVAGISDEEEELKPYLWIIGPLCAIKVAEIDTSEEFTFDRLHNLLGLGWKVDRTFPTRPDWEKHRQEENELAREFFAKHKEGDRSNHRRYQLDLFADAEWEDVDDQGS